MLRGENIVCGTSSNGTGTLTLASGGNTVGGTDLDVLARATGIGFGNNAAVLSSYTIIEFTDNTYTTPKQEEKGVGTLTLGASAGIANATLARTTVQQTATSLNAQPATYSVSAPSAINIGVAANTLIFIGAGAADIPAFSPYFDASGGGACTDTAGVLPPGPAQTGSQSSGALSNNTFYFQSFLWAVPMVAKRATIGVKVAYAGGTPVSNAYLRLYDVATTGRPGKLLYDFGLIGSANASLNATGNAATGAAGNGFLLLPGDYYMALAISLSGGTTPPEVWAGAFTMLNMNRIGSDSCVVGAFNPVRGLTAGGTVSSTPDDPAPNGSFSTGNTSFSFALKAS